MNRALLISEAFEIYRLEYIVYRNQSAKTEEMSICAKNALIAFCGDIPVTDLTFDLIRKWKTFLENGDGNLIKPKGQNTVRGYIIKLRVVLKHLILRGHEGIVNPDIVGVPKRVRTVIDYLTPEEVNTLIDTVFELGQGYTRINRYRNRALISFLYASGIRNSELCQLNKSSLHYEDNTFTVIGKGNKPRLCFFDDRSRRYIEEYLEMRDDGNPALFISELTNGRISDATLQEVFRNAHRRSGINKPIHPHTMRHSFATNMLKNNTNIVHVRSFLGHESVQTTEMYMHIADEDLREVYNSKHTITSIKQIIPLT